MRKELEKKVQQAIKLLQTTCKDRGVVEVAYSGGKDSDVILQLVKESGIEYRAIYKNTTIDPKGTIKHAIDAGAEVVRPDKSFFDIVKEEGFPNRFHRMCCKYLKEYKVLDTAIIGIRKSESRKRNDRYKEPTQCRIYSKKNDIRTYQIFPILEWSDKDVEEFIEDRKIKCHPIYYDDGGKFHVERRLGCQGCPMMSRNKRVDFFKKNPKWLKAWIRAGKDFYDVMVASLFYDSFKSFSYAKSDMFGGFDSKERLEEYFGIDLTI